jgi:hypothetical protein
LKPPPLGQPPAAGGSSWPQNRADARYLAQAFGLRLDGIEHLLTEGAHQLLGIGWPDAADHPGAEVFLDAVE